MSGVHLCLVILGVALAGLIGLTIWGAWPA